MFRRRSHRKSSVATRPDLPITPMLDMSFQLMAFFILTFRPAPTEAQIAMALPNAMPGEIHPIAKLEEPINTDSLTVQVYAAANGSVGNIVVALPTGDVPLGADSAALMRFLKQQKASRVGEQPTLKMEFVDGLQYGIAVKLLDEGRRAGYEKIVPSLFGAGM